MFTAREAFEYAHERRVAAWLAYDGGREGKPASEVRALTRNLTLAILEANEAFWEYEEELAGWATAMVPLHLRTIPIYNIGP